MKKNLIKKFAVAVCVLSSFSTTLYGGTIPKVNLNSQKVLMENSPFIEGGSTYVPLRTLSNYMGIKVDWDVSTKTTTLTQGDNKIICRVGSVDARVNNENIKMPVPVKEVSGTVYVPLKFVSQFMGGELKYDLKENVIDITYKMPEGLNLDRWGRIIRTTSLPKNASNYEYILQGVPNGMYEMITDYEIMIKNGASMIEGKDYTKSVNLSEVKDFLYADNFVNEDWYIVNEVWKKLVEKHMDMKLNVDYRTATNTWAESIAKNHMADYYTRFNLPEAKEYLKYLKDNHLIIEGDYYVEPSMTYCGWRYNMRVWVKFRVKSDKVKTAALYGDHIKGTGYGTISEYNVKTNVWYVGYTDVGLSSNIGGGDGSQLTIGDDALVWNSRKTLKVIK
jgi:hypothetical protein